MHLSSHGEFLNHVLVNTFPIIINDFLAVIYKFSINYYKFLGMLSLTVSIYQTCDKVILAISQRLTV